MDEHKRLIIEAAEMRAMLEKAAEDGARKALAGVGLHDVEAANDIRDIRQMITDWRAMKRGVLTSLGNVLVLGVLSLIGAGVWWHLRKGP